MGVSFFQRCMQVVLGLRSPSAKKNAKKLLDRGEQKEDFTIREISEVDIPAIAELHVKTWNDTYPFVKKTPTVALREWQWREQFKDSKNNWFAFVVENARGELIGFAGGRLRNEKKPSGNQGRIEQNLFAQGLSATRYR